MACIGSQYPDPIPAAFPRARRPALIPPNASLSPSEAEDYYTRLNQPPFPAPDPRLFQNSAPFSLPTTLVEPPMPTQEYRSSRESSPKVNFDFDHDPSTLPKAIVRDPRRYAAYIKARAHRARDQMLQHIYANDCDGTSLNTQETISPDHVGTEEHDSKPRLEDAVSSLDQIEADFAKSHLRKHSAFVLDEELKSQQIARADTPHISEVTPGEDVSAPEVGVGLDEGGLPMKRSSSVTSVTSVPDDMGGKQKLE